jgi:hypothetical protein
VAILEDDVVVQGPPPIDTTFSHLMRCFVGGVDGTEVNFPSPYPGAVTVTLEFDVVAYESPEWLNWDVDNLSIVAFLQNEESKDTEHGARLTLFDPQAVR